MFLFFLGVLVGGLIVHIFYVLKDEFKQGYLAGYKRGKGYDSNS